MSVRHAQAAGMRWLTVNVRYLMPWWVMGKYV